MEKRLNDIYIIENEFLKVKIDSFGAELNSLKKQNDDLEYLWNGDKKYWNRKAPVLFPIVGKLKDNIYFFKNKKFSMNQHGFARDKEFKVVEQGCDYLILLLESDESTLKIYPFNFEFYIFYKLKDNKVISYYKLINRSDEKQYFSLGAHPAFNWPLESGKKSDYYLEFEVDEELESYRLEDGYISNQKLKIDLEDKKLPLSTKLFSNDALIFEDLKVKTITYKNRLDKRSVTLSFDDFKYLGIWSKPSGSPFICIEPWCGIADFRSHNQNIEEKIGINILDEKESFEISFTIELN